MYQGARCWNPGWDSQTKNGPWASHLESIGVNLLDKLTCTMRSYWSNLYENEICAVSAPTQTTGVNGYGYHVVAGGKEACDGDEGAPLLCDIDGKVTLVGVNTRGYDQCGAEGYPAIHLNLNSIFTWMNEISDNQTGILWTEWSDCDSDCNQTRKRTKYETEIRDCERVCFKMSSDAIDDSLRTCSLTDDDRQKRDTEFQTRIMGGQSINSSSMKYVAKLVFDNDEQCVGTVVDKNFVLTTKFCCETSDTVTIYFENDSSELKSNTFYNHPSFESCLIRIEKDLSSQIDSIPCLPYNTDVNKYNGAACWNAGWGANQVDEEYSDQLKSIGINLMSQGYCNDHSFWDIQNGYICAGLSPSKSTPMMGWKHVTTGGKGTCRGDFGAPLICDIDGTAVFIGINSDGDLEECGLDGKPAIHLNVREIIPWILHTIEKNSPPKMCFELITDPAVLNAQGNGIKLLHNGVDIGFALNENEFSNRKCVENTQDGDIFTFVNGGKNNVSKLVIFVS